MVSYSSTRSIPSATTLAPCSWASSTSAPTSLRRPSECWMPWVRALSILATSGRRPSRHRSASGAARGAGGGGRCGGGERGAALAVRLDHVGEHVLVRAALGLDDLDADP